MQQQHADVHARVAGEGVAQVPVFPAGIGLDQEHLEGLGADGNLEGLPVVILDDFLFVALLPQGRTQSEGVMAGLNGAPYDGPMDLAVLGDGLDGLGDGNRSPRLHVDTL